MNDFSLSFRLVIIDSGVAGQWLEQVSMGSELWNGVTDFRTISDNTLE